MTEVVDFVVLGSGIAGLTFARKVAPLGDVVVFTKKSRTDSNTNWAQGGIAGVLSREDSVQEHVDDTIVAGAGLCDRDAVRTLVDEGPERIHELLELGARFDRENNDPQGELALTREGGHSRRRIVHSRDTTGREVERALVEAVARCPSVVVRENHMGIDLARESGGKGRVRGVHVLETSTGHIRTVIARKAVFLATGGCGHVYAHTSNPEIATGDGLAMAFRAGAEVEDLEFVQFHPTTLFHPSAASFLVSEAVRGEGGILRDRSGHAFMESYDVRGNLAPRDIVARAIDSEMKRQGDECMFLDVRHLGPDRIQELFPHIYSRCLSYGIDMAREMVPVVPAAHYMCGGVRSDLDGRTTLPGLWAAGEVACTGVHGANRLASNSLLEAMVFSHRAAQAVSREPDTHDIPDVTAFEPYRGTLKASQTDAIRHRIQRTMSKFVGIYRSVDRLEKASAALTILQDEVDTLYATFRPTEDLLEVRNLCTCARLIVASALNRRESRGLHAVEEWPQPSDDWLCDTILVRDRDRDFRQVPGGEIHWPVA